MFTVREIHKHGSRIEIPDVGPTHDIQAERTKHGKVDSCVNLFHKPRRFPPTADPTVDSPRSNKTLHNEFSGERQHNGVERHKGNILLPFSIHDWATGVLGRLRVGQEDGTVHRVGRCRIDSIDSKKDGHDNKREQPSVLQAEVFEATKRRTMATAFSVRFSRFLSRTLLKFLGE